jgi:thioredoxin 1
VSEHITVTETNFEEEVLNSPLPVLLDFWAAWCAPCRMIGPMIDQLAKEYSGRLKVCKVNVDEEENLAVRHEIASIPTLFVYKDGKITSKSAGALPKPRIEALFKDIV